MAFRVERVAADAPDVAAILDRHVALMRAQTPAESCHVLPAEALMAPHVTMLGLRDGPRLVAIGALAHLGDMAEIKSMHTIAEARGRGAARRLLDALLDHARAAGIARVSLETGSGDEHAAARALYRNAGFTECPPFGSYTPDPLSTFMTLATGKTPS